jgi:S1-C subfamily serine protease
MLKEFLSQRGIAYTERDISIDRAAAAEVTRLTGQLAVPVTVVDGQVIVGFDRPKLEQALASTHPSLGAAVKDATPSLGVRTMPSTGGAYVGSVKPGSLAQRLGLNTGDIITQINGQTVSGAADLERAILGWRAGSQVRVSFSRGADKLTASGTL